MTRFRGESYETESGQIVTHCTIDTGVDTPQTAITFRSGDWGCDVMSCTRPFPKSTQGSLDSSSKLRYSYV